MAFKLDMHSFYLLTSLVLFVVESLIDSEVFARNWKRTKLHTLCSCGLVHMGKHSGSVVENDLLFITKKRFPQTGTYNLKFVQAMRQDDLNEILDVGLRIKEVKAN